MARFGTGGRTLVLTGALRRPDGRLLVTASELPAASVGREELVVEQLTADGAPDRSFGEDGVARTGLSGFTRAALAPDGSVVLTGSTGETGASQRWAVARLTPAGLPDPAFATRPVPGSLAGDGGLVGAEVAPDGRIAVLGARRTQTLAMRLRPDGSPDPAWGGGAPVRIPVRATDFATAADGSLSVLGLTRVARLTGGGAPDTAYGANGFADIGDSSFGRLLAEPGGGVIVYRTPSRQARPAADPALVLDRLSATGARTSAQPRIRVGGGATSLRTAIPTPLRQNAFAIGALLRRPDGSFLAAGGVSLIQYTGEGEGTSAAQHAVVALTPQLTVDRAFGPAFARPSAAVRPARRQARRDRRRHLAVRLRVRASGPGLLRVQVRTRRARLLAGGVVPVYRAGDEAVRLGTTRRGRRALRHRVAVRVTGTFRDLGTATVRARPGRGRVGG